jgi:hypothetical protein
MVTMMAIALPESITLPPPIEITPSQAASCARLADHVDRRLAGHREVLR